MLLALPEIVPRTHWTINRADGFGLEAAGNLTSFIWSSDRSLVTILTELFLLQLSHKSNFNRKVWRVNGFASRGCHHNIPWRLYL